MNAKPILCYVNEPWAYFTTQALEDQWGDDWDDAPYEHNAGPPYEFGEHDKKAGKPPWTIVKLAWEGPFDPPCSGMSNSPFSVRCINRGAVTWLRTSRYDKSFVAIPAGVTIDEFCRRIRQGGGKVYKEIEWRL